MMSFEEFRENILQEIRVRAGGIFQVKKHDVIKNNNVKQTGIAVVKEEADIGPCVYLDEFYREYEFEGMKLGEIADEVYRLILKYEEDTPDVDLSGYRNWETVHSDIYPKLVNAEQNKELLEKIPHRDFLDLAVVYYAIARDHAREDIGTFLIHNGHMVIWEQEEEDLYQTALMNMRADGEADLIMIERIVEHILGIPFQEKEGNASRDKDMYILTNRRRRFGAAEILDKKTLRMIADQVGDGFIVLPSSIHETNLSDNSSRDMGNDLAVDLNANSHHSKQDVDGRMFAQIMIWALGQNEISCNAVMKAFGYGWNRASHFIERLCEAGIVGELDAKLPRKVIPQTMAEVSEKAKDFLQNCGYTEDMVAETIRNRESC